MKIIVKKNRDKNEYDEFLAILGKSSKVIKNPRMKIKPETKSIKTNIILGIVILVLLVIDESLKHSKINVITFILITLLMVVLYFMLMKTNKRIQKNIKKDSEITLEITKSKIEYIDGKEKFIMLWDDVKAITINNYCICFIPKSLPGMLISISVDYYDQIVKEVIDLKKEDLLVDNRSLYRK